MTNIIQIIKEQISTQTQDPVNTNVASVPIISSSGERVETTNTTPTTNELNPTWLRGYYSLSRVNKLTPDEFVNYSGQITWGNVQGLSISVPDVPNTQNNILMQALPNSHLWGLQLVWQNQVLSHMCIL